VFFSFFLSFQLWNMFSSEHTFVGLDNYGRVLTNPEFWSVLSNTFVYTLGTIPLNMSLALLVAALLNKKIAGSAGCGRPSSPGRHVVRCRGGHLAVVYEPNFGLLNWFLGLFACRPSTG